MVKTRQLLWTLFICTMLATGAAFAQSTLTQVRDTVVNTDGTPFNGTVVITWNGFTGSGSSAPLSTSARIYNGALSVLLVPTSTASPGTFYQVVYYNGSEIATWTETWQVPQSTTPLTLSVVRTSTTQGSGGSAGGGGTSGGGGSTPPGTQYATLPIAINQVTSLSADLASINASVAGLTAQVNSLSLNSGTSNVTTAAFIDGEAVAGSLNGSNAVFTLSHPPSPLGSLNLYRNGLLQSVGIDYSISSSTVTFLTPSIPKSTDVVTAYYRIAGTALQANFVDYETPAGSIDGNNTTFTLLNPPNPGGSLKLYKNGVLLNPNFDYTLNGSNITFASPAVTPQPGDILMASYRH